MSIQRDICNFHKVDEDLYRGGRVRSDSAYSRLAELGIRTIVNLEGAREDAKEKAKIDQLNQVLTHEHKPTIDFVSFPINPFPQVFLTGVSDRGVQSLFGWLQKARKPIFIHCRDGKDRTGAVVLLYRVKRNELSFNKAYDEALHYQFNWWLDWGLKSTIRRYRNKKKLDTLPSPNLSAIQPGDVCLGEAFLRP